eukprot:9486002-Pyramimonas_sp.AAC.1
MVRFFPVSPHRRPSWVALTAALGLSWGPLWPSWGFLGCFGGFIGPSWGPLEPSLGSRGRFWGGLREMLEAVWAVLGL